MDPEQVELAMLLIKEVRTTLASGVRHYNAAGTLLTNELEIIEALLTEGGVTFEQGTDLTFEGTES